jgi:glycosyltransferase involved in cell wall biosynthesis
MENKTPKVSIGMPVFNGGAYIRDALDSLLAQTFTDFELIISDNCSVDDTQHICEYYAELDPRIRYVRQSCNKGPVANFKFVLDEACADLFIWAAHDDLWAQDFLMDATTLLQEQNIKFVFPTFELRSIRLGIARKVESSLFEFIRLSDRRKRILHFMNLHYLSHSANIVYSLFRSEFLRNAWEVQNVGNDGALGNVILSQGCGALSNSLFSKRYKYAWPGMLPSTMSIISGWVKKRDVNSESQNAIAEAKLKMINQFPEFKNEITFIFDRYQPFKHDSSYQISKIEEVL